jgi:hypothetical protein
VMVQTSPTMVAFIALLFCRNRFHFERYVGSRFLILHQHAYQVDMQGFFGIRLDQSFSSDFIRSSIVNVPLLRMFLEGSTISERSSR